MQGANVEIRRDELSNKAYVWALETISPGSELTVHYGPEYWQEHFFSCPDSVQQAAAQCYNLVVVNGRCYQTTELRKLRAQGQAHQFRGLWFLGPRARPSAEGLPPGTTPYLPVTTSLCPSPIPGAPLPPFAGTWYPSAALYPSPDHSLGPLFDTSPGLVGGIHPMYDAPTLPTG